ncbi:hypothetical protein TNIN_69161, partial [Trichonephila inaurata madagascariensis]
SIGGKTGTTPGWPTSQKFHIKPPGGLNPEIFAALLEGGYLGKERTGWVFGPPLSGKPRLGLET